MFTLFLVHPILRISPYHSHHLRSQSPSVTPSTFHSRLKTHLFHKSFPPYHSYSFRTDYTDLKRLVTSSAQARYALRVLRTRGLDALSQRVFRATVVARLTYAASAWRGLTKASESDRQRINSVLDRARRHGYCPPDLPTFDELCDTADEELFSKTVKQSHHVL